MTRKAALWTPRLLCVAETSVALHEAAVGHPWWALFLGFLGGVFFLASAVDYIEEHPW